MSTITVVADETNQTSGSIVGNQAIVAADALQQLLGWRLEDEGLCRSDVCVPIADRSRIERGGGVDLVGVADALGRPTLIDADAATVVIGAPAADRSAALHDRRAPDFSLPDLDGVPRTLAGWTGKKRLLVAFASW